MEMWKQLRYSRQRSEWKVYIIAIRLAGKSSFLGERIISKIFFQVKSVNNVAEESLRSILVVRRVVVDLHVYGKAERTIKSADPVCFWCNTGFDNALRRYRRPRVRFFTRRRNPSARWKMMGSTRDEVFARRSVYTGCFEYVWITASRMWYELALFLRRERSILNGKRMTFLLDWQYFTS